MKEDIFEEVKTKKETKPKAKKVSKEVDTIKEVIKNKECGDCTKRYGTVFCKSCVIYKKD